jgi:hypothetical protein
MSNYIYIGHKLHNADLETCDGCNSDVYVNAVQVVEIHDLAESNRAKQEAAAYLKKNGFITQAGAGDEGECFCSDCWLKAVKVSES